MYLLSSFTQKSIPAVPNSPSCFKYIRGEKFNSFKSLSMKYSHVCEMQKIIISVIYDFIPLQCGTDFFLCVKECI